MFLRHLQKGEVIFLIPYNLWKEKKNQSYFCDINLCVQKKAN